MADLAELQSERTRLEKEHRAILDQIHELRRRAKEKTIIASDTHRPQDPAEIRFWQEGISRNQTELMAVQSKIAATNKAIREARAAGGKPAGGAAPRARDREGVNDDAELTPTVWAQTRR